MPYTPDRLIMPALVALRDCLCTELTDRGLGDNCKCVLVHGDAANAREPAVGTGFAWVGVNRIFPSSDGLTEKDEDTSCGDLLAAEITIGVIRCYKVSATGYDSPDDMMLWLDRQLADMEAMRAAFLCCDFDVIAKQLGDYTPFGPEGGVVGGSWSGVLGQADG